MKAKNSDISTNMEGYLEEIFDQFQEFVSTELHIIKRIDDNDFDENLFYQGNTRFFNRITNQYLLTNQNLQ